MGHGKPELEKKDVKMKLSEYEGLGHAYPDDADAELAEARETR